MTSQVNIGWNDATPGLYCGVQTVDPVAYNLRFVNEIPFLTFFLPSVLTTEHLLLLVNIVVPLAWAASRPVALY